TAAMSAVPAAAVAMLAALIAGIATDVVMRAALGWIALLAAAGAADYRLTRRAWLQTTPRMTRLLPASLAVGKQCEIQLNIEAMGSATWQIELFDHSDPSLLTQGLPVTLEVGSGKRVL